MSLKSPRGPWLNGHVTVSHYWDYHDDVIKWKHFPHYWPFVLGIHWSPVNSPHKGQWHGALMFSLICTWLNGSANNGEANYSRRHRAHHYVTVMIILMPYLKSHCNSYEDLMITLLKLLTTSLRRQWVNYVYMFNLAGEWLKTSRWWQTCK